MLCARGRNPRTGHACAIFLVPRLVPRAVTRGNCRQPAPPVGGSGPSSSVRTGAGKDVGRHTTRKPMLLLRFAERRLSGLLFQAPPRNTRCRYQAAPRAEARPKRVGHDGADVKSPQKCAR